MTRILIAVDGSDLDLHVAATAHRIFGDDAEYLAVNVADSVVATAATMPVPYGVVYPYVPPGAVDPSTSDVERIERAADVARRVTEESGIEGAEVIGDVGDPGEAIVAAAARHDVAVIVVGSHERSWFSRLVGGSVSSEVMADSTVPVMVVKSTSVVGHVDRDPEHGGAFREI